MSGQLLNFLSLLLNNLKHARPGCCNFCIGMSFLTSCQWLAPLSTRYTAQEFLFQSQTSWGFVCSSRSHCPFKMRVNILYQVAKGPCTSFAVDQRLYTNYKCFPSVSSFGTRGLTKKEKFQS